MNPRPVGAGIWVCCPNGHLFSTVQREPVTMSSGERFLLVWMDCGCEFTEPIGDDGRAGE